MLFGKNQSESTGSQYIPFTLGLPRPGSASYNEFLILGKNSGDNQNRVVKAVIERKARLVSYFSCPANEDHSLFSMSCVVDCSDMGRASDDLLISIRKLGFIVRAEKASMHNKVFSNFAFPVSLIGKNSSVILDASIMFEIFERSSGMEEAGRKYASNVIESLRPSTSFVQTKTRKEARDILVQSVQSYFMACGLGRLSFDFESNDRNELYGVSSVVVRDLPRLRDGQELEFTSNASWVKFLKGLVNGLLETIVPDVEDKSIVGESFNKHDRSLTFFVSRSDQPTRPQTVEARADDFPKQQSSESKTQMKEIPAVVRASTGSHSESSRVDSDQRIASRPSIQPSQYGKVETENHVTERSPKANLQNSKILMRILAAAKNGATKITIMHKARLRYSERNEYIDLLVELELLELTRPDDGSEPVYQTTAKGIDYLDLYRRLEINSGDPYDLAAPLVTHSSRHIRTRTEEHVAGTTDENIDMNRSVSAASTKTAEKSRADPDQREKRRRHANDDEDELESPFDEDPISVSLSSRLSSSFRTEAD